MPSKKNQHYLPKFYLRNFGFRSERSEEANLITLFTKSKKYYYDRAPLMNQCSKSYYYDKDATTEDWLADIDSLTSQTIHKVCTEKQISSDDIFSLKAFIAITVFRNPVQVHYCEQIMQNLQSQLIKDGVNENNKKLQQLLSPRKEIIQMMLSFVKEAYVLFGDLNIKLIINETNQPFITSDNPVVLYNQLAETKNWFFSGMGAGSVGIQYFFPLTPKLMVVMYDGSAYKFGQRNSQLITAGNISDIDQLNILQFLNSHNIVYGNDQINKWSFENYFRLHLKYPKANITTIKKFPLTATNNDVIWQSKQGCRIKLLLSFVQIRTNAKQIDASSGKNIARPHALRISETDPRINKANGYDLTEVD